MKLVFYSSTATMMRGPINIRLKNELVFDGDGIHCSVIRTQGNVLH